MTRTIPLAVPLLGGNEGKYLQECLTTGMVSSVGPLVDRFERAMAEYVEVPHAVAVNSGTAGLHVSLLVAGVRPGDLVLAPDLTFIASINAIRYAGAEPVLLDANRGTWQIDPEAVASWLERHSNPSAGGTVERNSGRRIGAILCVHLMGMAADVAALGEIARRYGIPLVHDAAQGVGARVRGRSLGATPDVAVFSFNGNKVLTAGGGGMILTAHREWAERARYLTTQARDDNLFFRHDAVGYNYRLSNLHAGVGLAQLERVEEFIARKRVIHRRYRDELASCSELCWVEEQEGDRAAYWLSSCTIDGGRDRRDRVLRRLLDAGIEARPPYLLMHKQLPYREAMRGPIGSAEEIEATGLHLPSSAGLPDQDQSYVIERLKAALAT